MHRTRTSRLVIALLAIAVLLGVSAPAMAKDDDKGEQQAHRSLEQARKAREKQRRNPAVTEAKGTVAAVDAAAKTFQLQVAEANQAGLRGTKVTVQLAPAAYVVLNDRSVTLADVKAGDGAKVTGLMDGAKLTAYLVRLDRRAPAPAVVKGSVSAVTATGFTLLVNGAPVALTLGSPSIVTLNGATATLADIHVGDKGEATTVAGVAYVARFTRSIPVPSPTTLKGTLSSVSPLTLFANGMSTPIQLATPSIVSLNEAPAAPADLHVGDRCTAVGISSPPALVAYQLACRRP